MPVPGGQVWARGANQYGQLGDGSTVAKAQPVPVGGPDFAWGVVLPTFAPPAGTYASAQSVAITTATPGAVIHYTTSGVEPTEGDPVLEAGATVPVDHALTLMARAWKPGVEPSGVGHGELRARLRHARRRPSPRRPVAPTASLNW